MVMNYDQRNYSSWMDTILIVISPTTVSVLAEERGDSMVGSNKTFDMDDDG